MEKKEKRKQMPGFILCTEDMDAISSLSDRDFRRVMRALKKVARNDDPTDEVAAMTKAAKIAFRFMAVKVEKAKE